MHINIWTLIIVPEDYLKKETGKKQKQENVVKTKMNICIIRVHRVPRKIETATTETCFRALKEKK